MRARSYFRKADGPLSMSNVVTRGTDSEFWDSSRSREIAQRPSGRAKNYWSLRVDDPDPPCRCGSGNVSAEHPRLRKPAKLGFRKCSTVIRFVRPASHGLSLPKHQHERVPQIRSGVWSRGRSPMLLAYAVVGLDPVNKFPDMLRAVAADVDNEDARVGEIASRWLLRAKHPSDDSLQSGHLLLAPEPHQIL